MNPSIDLADVASHPVWPVLSAFALALVAILR
jgi:hypothetical protein